MTGASFQTDGGVLTITLDRPERKNPLTFELYAQLRERFRALGSAADVKSVVLKGAGDNFCSGGDVHEIIGPLTRSTPDELLRFTRMTGDVVKAMRACPQPIVAAVDGVAAGAGAILAMASDLRLGTDRARIAFLFVRVGLAGCDMGACAMLPRIVGLGRAAELLYTGRVLGGTQAYEWGFFNELCAPDGLHARAREFAEDIAAGPTLAHAMTKRMLHEEWALPLDDAIDAEARALARLMESGDFRRAYEAFVEKRTPRFEGN
ncbi:MAG: enoyl-CoA hydratase family protein [Candidatus Eremiobacteraeota bacterium]|nr:enoyl-CoA hydratase family protein [Candidatus Eremiobacteraeota bacterium]